ncbi:ankyrin repeat and SOCS box protein 4-like [Synchiropus splendidus]|uniref:ankyrin repeat and SOCS box protein 4-like n=1 Tax=Synchiropus splendidus TaxID=270530 RepID=UPI00237E56E5|nr:ankyrin repeat and SOCS box protein 4-like [Synchiropus splendidus]
MVDLCLSFICAVLATLLCAAWMTSRPQSADVAKPFRGEGGSFGMEEVHVRKADLEQWKQKYLEAIQANDAPEVHRILRTGRLDVDTVLEVEDPGMVLASYKQGYWLPDYKLEKSWAMGLHLCVVYNALDAAMVLLENGAATNKMPNGKTPLHVACQTANSDFVTLLLASWSKINILSLSGHTPLHHCATKESIDCARLLLCKGADVNKADNTSDQNTPLHRAAQCGLPQLVTLYLQHGASVDALNSAQETPLMKAAFSSLDAKAQVYSPEHQLVCRILLDWGADPNVQDETHKTALHRAAWNLDQVVMQMLLEAGSDTRAMDADACAPLQYLLKVTDRELVPEPELCFMLLLNYNAARIYPPQFHMVLYHCHRFPKVIETLVNSYPLLLPTKRWRPAVPDDSYQRHRAFYDSMFAVCSKRPRSLQHLARCAIRASLGGFCQNSVPQLPLPSAMKRYVLLYPEGILC